MPETPASYTTSTTLDHIALSAHACKERVVKAQSELDQLLSGIRAEEISAEAALQCRNRILQKLREAVEELE